MKANPARQDDYLEFFAEIDLLCALSCCPGGDLSVDLWGPEARDPLETCHPLGVEVYSLEKERLAVSAACTLYKGRHGHQLPETKWVEIKKNK